ncbi:IS1 family transposase [Tatumella ptyseos]|uniref:IS1 family transposase n=1 Tax=Tatumella ptyseos TaxID=82987 RepID=UPI003BAF73D2
MFCSATNEYWGYVGFKSRQNWPMTGCARDNTFSEHTILTLESLLKLISALEVVGWGFALTWTYPTKNEDKLPAELTGSFERMAEFRSLTKA